MTFEQRGRVLEYVWGAFVLIPAGLLMVLATSPLWMPFAVGIWAVIAR